MASSSSGASTPTPIPTTTVSSSSGAATPTSVSSSPGAANPGEERMASSWSGAANAWWSRVDPFDILAKGAPVQSLEIWRREAVVLNPYRRFRYTADLENKELVEKSLREIRLQSYVKSAAYKFRETAQVLRGSIAPRDDDTPDFRITFEQLVLLTREENYSALVQYKGVSGVARMLRTDTKEGITGEDFDLKARKFAFGSNIYSIKKRKTFMYFLWEVCQDKALSFLMFAAALLVALGIAKQGIKEGWYGGAGIAFAVLLIVLVTAGSDTRESVPFQLADEEKQDIVVEVVRCGKEMKIPACNLVVGDVVSLMIGDQIPADGIYISGNSCSTSGLTISGDIKIVKIDKDAPFMTSGCYVADGYATMLVTAVGHNTEWGLLMGKIDSGEETPLQVRLNGVATFVGRIGYFVAFLVLGVFLARYFTGHTHNLDGSPQYLKGKMGLLPTAMLLLRYIILAVTIVVVAVPEGLPLAVTLTLANVMEKMQNKALVRRLSAFETMGLATTICCGTTGSLTLYKMIVAEAYFGGKKIDLTDTVSSVAMEGIAQNTSGSIFEPEGADAEVVARSPTEDAILCWALLHGMKFNEIRSNSTILDVSPFNSEKKICGIALRMDDTRVHVHWKGAAELILGSCKRWFDEDDLEQPMTTEKVLEFTKIIEDMADKCLQCVAFAYKRCNMTEMADLRHLPEDDLVMLGIVGIEAHFHEKLKESIRSCKDAGIEVRIVTEDDLRYAKAIALRCGILQENPVDSLLMEGEKFRALSDSERANSAKELLVLAGSSSNDKLLLVKALKSNGDVVAVTGDGANDAPALREGDIGLSMGILGTELAKQSSDITILDDDFASIEMVVRCGRALYANIQKFIEFELTMSVAALIIIVVSASSSDDVLLNAVQLLWINLIMDTLGALALAREPPNNHLMKGPPVGRREPLITNIMWRNMFFMVIFQVSTLLALNYKGRSCLLQWQHDDTAHAEKVINTFIFNTFVLCQVFNAFNVRKPDQVNIFKDITRNYFFIAFVAITVGFQVLLIEVFGKFTSTVRLSWQLWVCSLLLASLSWLVGLLLKFINWLVGLLCKFIPVPHVQMLLC